MDQLRKILLLYNFRMYDVHSFQKGDPVHLRDTFRVSVEFVFGLPVIFLQSLVEVSLQKFVQKTVGRVSAENHR